MARSKAISYGGLIIKNRYNTNILSILSHRTLPRPTTASQSRRAFCDLNGNQELPPPPPPPSSPLSSNSTKWTAGIVVTAVISFLQFKEDVDLVMRKGEEILDVVEVVAEAVDMVAEKIVDDLPEGGKLKTAVEFVEEVAETVTGKAQKVVDFIDEVQEAEKKLSPVIEPVKQLTQVGSTEGS
ncbi:hypothetical protein SSX86_011907 [Deinandra increscens subsp. villosa]|uniref:Uncharacterized protein n=1 Tax=Deinandra increscens subsp. villosa TaxID=3103831 RepID=A0AAP0D349_9ASTR